HIQRMPRAGQLQAGVLDRVRVGWNRHFVIEPPAPFALVAKKVVDHALDDLTISPVPARGGIFELGVPFRPPVFLANWSGRRKQLAPRAQRGNNSGAQFSGKCRNGLFNVDFPAIDFPGCKQLRKLSENILTNHSSKAPSLHVPAYDHKPPPLMTLIALISTDL